MTKGGQERPKRVAGHHRTRSSSANHGLSDDHTFETTGRSEFVTAGTRQATGAFALETSQSRTAVY